MGSFAPLGDKFSDEKVGYPCQAQKPGGEGICDGRPRGVVRWLPRRYVLYTMFPASVGRGGVLNSIGTDRS